MMAALSLSAVVAQTPTRTAQPVLACTGGTTLPTNSLTALPVLAKSAGTTLCFTVPDSTLPFAVALYNKQANVLQSARATFTVGLGATLAASGFTDTSPSCSTTGTSLFCADWNVSAPPAATAGTVYADKQAQNFGTAPSLYFL